MGAGRTRYQEGEKKSGKAKRGKGIEKEEKKRNLGKMEFEHWYCVLPKSYHQIA